MPTPPPPRPVPATPSEAPAPAATGGAADQACSGDKKRRRRPTDPTAYTPLKPGNDPCRGLAQVSAAAPEEEHAPLKPGNDPLRGPVNRADPEEYAPLKPGNDPLRCLRNGRGKAAGSRRGPKSGAADPGLTRNLAGIEEDRG